VGRALSLAALPRTGADRPDGAAEPPPTDETAPRGGRGAARAHPIAKVRAYVALTKPRIIELLLVTTIPTMVLAAGGLPRVGLVLATLVGGAAAAGAANTLNCVLDRDIDGVMNRTRRRPLVTGEVTANEALVLGYALAASSVLWFGLLVNWAAAALTLAAILLYVVGYTMLLKRRTSQNIVWGGAAGCMPVLIGWSAVTGGVGWPALVLFGVIFFWTPPHYWPLSMKFRRDYAAAGVPMLPVVAEDGAVARQMVAYAAAMVGCTLLLVPVAHMGRLYTGAAVVLGAWFTGLCVRLLVRARRGAHRSADAMRVFHASITYLTLLFAAVAVDPFLPF
jgi:protoheme IX farnesyltransferase